MSHYLVQKSGDSRCKFGRKILAKYAEMPRTVPDSKKMMTREEIQVSIFFKTAELFSKHEPYAANR